MATTEQIDQEQELKERLHLRIDQVHDLTALKGLSLLLDSLAPKTVYVLTPEEEKMLDEAEKRLDAGQGISGEEFKKRRSECLKNLAKNFG